MRHLPSRLVTIPFSHYCERARWALDHTGVPYVEDAYPPGLHMRPARKAGGRTVPILVLSNQTLLDSRAIVLHCDQAAMPERRLYPEDPDARRDVLATEQAWDAQLGVVARALVYFHMLPRPSALAAVVRPGLTRMQALLMPLGFRVIASELRRMYKLNAASAARDAESLRRIFGEVGVRLEDHKYLSGDRFGAADITFASLAAPVLLPARHPAMTSSIDGMPDELRALALELRGSRAGAHALRVYEEHRRPSASGAARA